MYYRDERGCLERFIEIVLGLAIIVLILILFGRWIMGLHGYWFS